MLHRCSAKKEASFTRKEESSPDAFIIEAFCPVLNVQMKKS